MCIQLVMLTRSDAYVKVISALPLPHVGEAGVQLLADDGREGYKGTHATITRSKDYHFSPSNMLSSQAFACWVVRGNYFSQWSLRQYLEKNPLSRVLSSLGQV